MRSAMAVTRRSWGEKPRRPSSRRRGAIEPRAGGLGWATVRRIPTMLAEGRIGHEVGTLNESGWSS